MSSLFEKLGSLWTNFDSFRQAITSYSFKYYNEQIPEDLTAALTEMRNHFTNAMYTAQGQFFPLLRKNALEVRLARIEEAAKLLELHQQDQSSINAKEELRQLANDLACLTYYPVGPAFDKLKFSLPKDIDGNSKISDR